MYNCTTIEFWVIRVLIYACVTPFWDPSLLERDCATCAVYLRENIQPLLSQPTHFAHVGLARNVLKNL